MSELPERRTYGEYEIESFLGKGSIGKVWLARHRRIGRRVALKTVVLDQKFEDEDDAHEFYRRLQREVELCAAMQHPNIVTLYDVGYSGEVVSYFATEYVDGESLLTRLRRTRPLPLHEALSIATDLLRGLAYAQSKGIIHRDIKPANILLTSDGHAKIADFGVARPLNSSLTVSRSLVGTPNYMSPEQVKTAPVSPRSDLFSAGIVLYEMLTGMKPFSAPELSGILYNVVNHHPPAVSEVNPGVPAALAAIVAKLLAKNPEDRYGTAGEALAELNAVVHEPVTASALSAEEVGATPHDNTSPMATVIEPRDRQPVLRREVPASLFWIVSLVLAAALGYAVYTLSNAVENQRPLPMITAEHRQRHSAKMDALRTARAYIDAGRYAEGIAAYDALIARHPESLVARVERDHAQQMLEAATPKAEVTKVARKPRRIEKKPAAEPEEPLPPPKPGRWERLKKWFRGTS